MNTIKHCLELGQVLIKVKLEAEILLAAALQRPRSYLYAYPEEEVSVAENKIYTAYLARRQQQEPIAYIIGIKEFWSLPLMVTPATLIPREETELLVQTVLDYTQGHVITLADLGTGSGAIAIALGKEHPDWRIVATDSSPAALEVAKTNAKNLQCENISFYAGDWCQALPKILFNVIVSNPPYISYEEWPTYVAGLAYEPKAALLAEENGLADFLTIIQDAKRYLAPGGFLFLEHGFQQGQAIRSALKVSGYQEVQTFCDLAGLERVSLGRGHA